MASANEVAARAARFLVPPPRLRLSEWIEAHVRMPEAVALPGPVRLWPFQRGIADAIGDPEIERVTLVKPVRVGFTTLLTSAVAGYVVNEPAHILAVLPTEADCRRYIVSEVEPIFDASPVLAGTLGAEVDERGRNTLTSRHFAGGSLKVVAARAPRNLRSHTARVLLMDEIDGMEMTGEGSPIDLAEKRTMSYADRKIVLGSTPVHEETSLILAAWAASDQRVFEVPCPDCGAFGEILWDQIAWAPGEPEGAWWRCPKCGGCQEERAKTGMVEAGRWRATRPEVKGHAGFRLNALVSPLANAAWGKLAAEWLAAQRDPTKLQVFVNTILGQGWREAGEEIDETEVASRAERFGLDAIPTEVVAITAGVDVQHDRLECTFVGWAEAGTAFVLGHTIAWGQWDDDLTWAELDEALRTVWRHQSGHHLGVAAALVDAGDGKTMDKVLAFCGPRRNRRILAGKGAPGNRPWLQRPQTKRRGGARLHIVGTDGIKATILQRVKGSSSIRFSDTLEPVWFEQLAGERLTTRYSRGVLTRQWNPVPGRRNEALDCTVYAFAARKALPDNLGLLSGAVAAPKPAAKAAGRDSGKDWLGGRGKSWL